MIDQGRVMSFRGDPLALSASWPVDWPMVMLHSGRHHARWARQTIASTPVAWYACQSTSDQQAGDHPGGASVWHRLPHAREALAGGAASAFRELDARLNRLDWRHDPLADVGQAAAADPGALWIGYVSYDVGRWIERLPARARADRPWPIVWLGYCPGWLSFDLAAHQWRACGAWAADGPPAQLTDAFASAEATDAQTLAEHDALPLASELVRIFSRAAYESAVARCIDYIAAGDIFQVNLAQRLSADLHGSAPTAHRRAFRRLARVSPAWYGAYLELGDLGGDGVCRSIASTSPELFLEVSSAGRVITRPIKGTRPASADAAELRDSEKDQAELNMIVDLLRNDLGRVCEYGTVRVTQPRTIESHPTVHHGVATIEGQLKPGADICSLLRAAMPGGSITGAPKVRAMEIIDEIEPVRRGPYCGAIGYLSGDHGSMLNVAIRTMLLESREGAVGCGGVGRVDFSVGGGIVADSNPAAEYQETLDKAAAMLRALGLSLDA